MAINYNASTVLTSLKSCYDYSNPKSLINSTTWKDLIRGTVSTTSGADTNIGNEPWMNGNGNQMTILTVIDKKGTHVGYAEHPVNKWIDTTDASFVLYHFGTTSGEDNNFRWHANAGGTWKNISNSFMGVNGNKYIIVLQYNALNGGQLWINGAKVSSRAGSGTIASTTNPALLRGPQGSVTAQVLAFQFWDRELSDNEIILACANYKHRYGI